jgi:hypothetical protein
MTAARKPLWVLYRLYHGLKPWNWFSSIGREQPLPSLAADIDALATTLRGCTPFRYAGRGWQRGHQ